MFFPPPVDQTPRLDCPRCGQLTPKAEARCVHCDHKIPESYRQAQKAVREARRIQAKKKALMWVPIGLVLLTGLFWALGVR